MRNICLFIRNSCVCIVERYDPKANKWLSVSSMNTRRKHLGCAVYNGYICMLFSRKIIWIKDEYLDAVGGRDDAIELSTAERFNPKINQWSPVVAMNSRRSGVRLNAKKKGTLFIDFLY